MKFERVWIGMLNSILFSGWKSVFMELSFLCPGTKMSQFSEASCRSMLVPSSFYELSFPYNKLSENALQERQSVLWHMSMMFVKLYFFYFVRFLVNRCPFLFLVFLIHLTFFYFLIIFFYNRDHLIFLYELRVVFLII